EGRRPGGVAVGGGARHWQNAAAARGRHAHLDQRVDGVGGRLSTPRGPRSLHASAGCVGAPCCAPARSAAARRLARMCLAGAPASGVNAACTCRGRGLHCLPARRTHTWLPLAGPQLPGEQWLGAMRRGRLPGAYRLWPPWWSRGPAGPSRRATALCARRLRPPWARWLVATATASPLVWFLSCPVATLKRVCRHMLFQVEASSCALIVHGLATSAFTS